jgi:hypothetical protein
LAHGVIRGKKDLRLLYGAAYGSLNEVRWSEEFREADRALMIATVRIGPPGAGRSRSTTRCSSIATPTGYTSLIDD